MQGNILRGYKRLHHAAYVFYAIDGGQTQAARALIAGLLAPSVGTGIERFTVTSDEEWRDRAEVHDALNIAFTYPGLCKLGWGRAFEHFDDFTQGMHARAEDRLRDRGESAPGEWAAGLRWEADVLFTLHAHTASRLRHSLARLRDRLDSPALEIVSCQLAGRRAPAAAASSAKGFGAREHFGFRDGFSQPVLALPASDRETTDARGEGARARPLWLGSRWRPLALGEFLLGYRDEDGVIAGARGPGTGERSDADPALHDGTFMVWRKLRQDLDGFRAYFQDAARPGESPQALQAKVLGRWQDGTSLVHAPHGRPQGARDGRAPSNDFDYSEDPDGARCPLGSHVRRANPRAGLHWGTERTRRHRIIRRGMPYEEDDGEVGLVFVCFNASISRQFEQIQGNWLMDGDAFGLGCEQDLLMGDGVTGRAMTIQGDRHTPVRFLARPAKPLVATIGGYYLFVPGMAALSRMLAGPAPPAPLASPLVFGVGAARFALRELARRLQHSGRVDDEPHA